MCARHGNISQMEVLDSGGYYSDQRHFHDPSGYNSWSALMEAAYNAQLPVVRHLIQRFHQGAYRQGGLGASDDFGAKDLFAHGPRYRTALLQHRYPKLLILGHPCIKSVWSWVRSWAARRLSSQKSCQQSQVRTLQHTGCCFQSSNPGLPLWRQAAVMTPDGVDFSVSFCSLFHFSRVFDDALLASLLLADLSFLALLALEAIAGLAHN